MKTLTLLAVATIVMTTLLVAQVAAAPSLRRTPKTPLNQKQIVTEAMTRFESDFKRQQYCSSLDMTTYDLVNCDCPAPTTKKCTDGVTGMLYCVVPDAPCDDNTCPVQKVCWEPDGTFTYPLPDGTCLSSTVKGSCPGMTCDDGTCVRDFLDCPCPEMLPQKCLDDTNATFTCTRPGIVCASDKMECPYSKQCVQFLSDCDCPAGLPFKDFVDGNMICLGVGNLQPVFQIDSVSPFDADGTKNITLFSTGAYAGCDTFQNGSFTFKWECINSAETAPCPASIQVGNSYDYVIPARTLQLGRTYKFRASFQIDGYKSVAWDEILVRALYPPIVIQLSSNIDSVMNSARSILYDKNFTLDASGTLDLAAGGVCQDCTFKWSVCLVEADWRCLLPRADILYPDYPQDERLSQYLSQGASSQVFPFESTKDESLIGTRWRINLRVDQYSKDTNVLRFAETFVVITIERKSPMPELVIMWPHAQFYYRKYQGHLVLKAMLGSDDSVHLKGYKVQWTSDPPLPMPYGDFRMQIAVRDSDLVSIQYRFSVVVTDLSDSTRFRNVSTLVQIGQGPRQLVSRSEIFTFSPAIETATEVRDTVSLSTNINLWEPHGDMEIYFRFAYAQQVGDLFFEEPIQGYDNLEEYSTRTTVSFVAPTSTTPIYFILYAKYLNGGETRVIHPLPFLSRTLIAKLSPSLVVREVLNVLDANSDSLQLQDLATLARALESASSPALTTAATRLTNSLAQYTPSSELRAWAMAGVVSSISKLPRGALTGEAFSSLCNSLISIGKAKLNFATSYLESDRRFFHAVSVLFNASIDSDAITRDDIGSCQTNLLPVVRSVSQSIATSIVEVGRVVELRTESSNFRSVVESPSSFLENGFQGPTLGTDSSSVYLRPLADLYKSDDTVTFAQFKIVNAYLWKSNGRLTADTRAMSLQHSNYVFDAKKNRVVNPTANASASFSIALAVLKPPYNDSAVTQCRRWTASNWIQEDVNTTANKTCTMRVLYEDVILIKPMTFQASISDRGEEMLTTVQVSAQLETNFQSSHKIELRFPTPGSDHVQRPTGSFTTSVQDSTLNTCRDLGWSARGNNVCGEYTVCKQSRYTEAVRECWSRGARLCTRGQYNAMNPLPPTRNCNETSNFWASDNTATPVCAFGQFLTSTGVCVLKSEFRSYMCCSVVDLPTLNGEWNNSTRIATLSFSSSNTVDSLSLSSISFSLPNFVNPVTIPPSYINNRDRSPRLLSDIPYARLVVTEGTTGQGYNVSLGSVEGVRPLRGADVAVKSDNVSTVTLFVATTNAYTNGTITLFFPRLTDVTYTINSNKTYDNTCDIKVIPGFLNIRSCAEECIQTQGCVAGVLRRVDGACVLKSCTTNAVDNTNLNSQAFTLDTESLTQSKTNRTLQSFWKNQQQNVTVSNVSGAGSLSASAFSARYDNESRSIIISFRGNLTANANTTFTLTVTGAATSTDPQPIYPQITVKDRRGTTTEVLMDLTLITKKVAMTANVRPQNRNKNVLTPLYILFQTAVPFAASSQLEVQFPLNSFTRDADGDVTLYTVSNATLLSGTTCSWTSQTRTLLCLLPNAVNANTKLWFTLLDFRTPNPSTTDYDPGVYPVFRINELIAGTTRYVEKTAVPQPFNPECDLISPTGESPAPTFKIRNSVVTMLEDVPFLSASDFVYDIVPGRTFEMCEILSFAFTFSIPTQKFLFKTGSPSIVDTALSVITTPDSNGNASVRITAIAPSGKRSNPINLTIIITPVNDPPTFQLGPNLVMAPNDFYQVRGWVYDMHGGPTPDEDVGVTFNFDVQLLPTVILPTDTRAPKVVPDVANRALNLDLYSGATTGTQNIQVAVIDNGVVNSRSNNYTKTVTVTSDWLVVLSSNQTFFEECSGVRIFVAYPRIPVTGAGNYTGYFSSNIPELSNYFQYVNEGLSFEPGSFMFSIDVPQKLLIRYAVDPFIVTFVSTRQLNGKLENSQSSVSITQNTKTKSRLLVNVRGSWPSSQVFNNDDKSSSYVSSFTVNNKNEAMVRAVVESNSCGIMKYRWQCVVEQEGYIKSTLCEDLKASGALSRSTLVIPPRTLIPGLVIAITGAVDSTFGKIVMDTDTIQKFTLAVSDSPLSPILVGGNERTVSILKPYTVDGSLSRDPMYSSSILCPIAYCSYSWSACRVEGTGCVPVTDAEEIAYFKFPSVTSTTLNFPQTPASMATKLYDVTFTMISNITGKSRVGAATTRLSFVSVDAPMLTITRMFDHPLAGEPTPNVNPTTRFILQGSWDSQTKVEFPATYNGQSWGLRWSVQPDLLQPLGRSGSTIGPADRLRLVVRENMHDPNVAQYKYTLVTFATINGNLIEVKSSVTVKTSKPVNNVTARLDVLYNSLLIPPPIVSLNGVVNLNLLAPFTKYTEDPLVYRYAFQTSLSAYQSPLSNGDEGIAFYLPNQELEQVTFSPPAISKSQTITYTIWARDTDGSIAYRQGDTKPINPPTRDDAMKYVDEIFFLANLTRDDAANALKGLRAVVELGTDNMTAVQRSRIDRYLTTVLTTLTATTPNINKPEDVQSYLSTLTDATSIAGALQDSQRSLARKAISGVLDKYLSSGSYVTTDVASQFLGTVTPLLGNFNAKGLGTQTTGATERTEMTGILTNVQKGMLNWIEDSERRNAPTVDPATGRTTLEAMVSRDSPYRFESEPIALMGSSLTTSSAMTTQIENQHASACSPARRLLRRMRGLANDPVCTQSSVREESADHTGMGHQPDLYLNRGLDASVPASDASSTDGTQLTGSLTSLVIGHTFRMKNFDKVDIHGMTQKAQLTLPATGALNPNNTQCSWFNEKRNAFWSIPSGSSPNVCLTDHFTDFALRALPPTTRTDPEDKRVTDPFPFWGIILIIGVISIIVFAIVLATRRAATKEEDAPVEDFAAPPIQREEGESVLDAAQNGRNV